MRTSLVLGALALNALVRQGVAHPLCYYDAKPTDPDQVLVFCQPQEEGSCCNDLEEIISITWYQEFFPEGSDATEECKNLYKQVLCGPCHSFSGHLYEELAAELGPKDGMVMTYEFCEELVETCQGQVDFPSYGGESYCEKHTLGSTGPSTDPYWSYPVVIETPSIGLTLAFENFPDGQLPSDLISMKMTPDGSEWWMAGQDGEIVQLSSVEDPTTSTTVLDISSGAELYVAYEEGLLDFCFSPAFSSNNYFYVSYTILDTEGAKNRLSRFTYSSTPAATLASIDVIVTSEAKATSIHSAGWVGFKPSDYANPSGSAHDIYWATGDGGPQTDPNGAGQDASNLLGAIIRVSVPSGTSNTDVGYTIPSGNYDGGATGRDEICAPGFRNPFRCGFDSETDELFCGDVGHTIIEEIDLVECGNNYGWSRFEGSRCQEAVENVFGDCDGVSRSAFTFPIYESCHSTYDSMDAGEDEFTAGVDICGTRSLTVQAIIGGHVYRGQQFSEVLGGAYLFADVQKNNIYYLTQKEGEWVPGIIVGDGTASIISFTEDINGEVYVITEKGTRNVYNLPCGELCSTTCVDQFDILPTFESVGCYGDNANNRALSLIQAPICPEGEEAMSPQICASYCATILDSGYFGVEYRSECFCGAPDEDFAKHGELDDLSCNYLCHGNSDEFCGGDQAIEVYEFWPSPVPSFGPVPVPPTPPFPTPAPTDEYLGCFGDSNTNRVFTGGSTSSSGMTTEFCASFCEDSQYYGTEFGIECFCSAEGDDYTLYGTAICNYPCSGDSTQVCGGKNAISVYLQDSGPTPEPEPTPAPAPVNGPEPTPAPAPTPTDGNLLGCYGDSNQGRALTGPSTKSTTSMTADFCASFCEASDFYATEFGIECFCSAEGDDYDVYGPATCDYACSGDSSEICGGKNAMTVYAQDSGPTPEPEPTPAPAPVNGPEPTPAPAPTPTDGNLLGCYGDSNQGRALTGPSTKSTTSMTADFCASFCEASDFYATEFGIECFCSAEGDDYDVYGSATCDYACSGDSTEICGGKNAMTVYAQDSGPTPEPEPTPAPVDGPAPTPSPESLSDIVYVGCYGDNSQARALTGPKTSSQSSMTSEFCADFCEGSEYFGTEFSYECFCSASGDDVDVYGTATCNYACTGDGDETCGGKNAISVYTYSDSPVPTPPPVPSTGYTYLGCFGDSNQGRVLTGSSTSSSSMTADACATFCEGSQYFGTEFSKECFCSVAGDDYDELGTATCDYPCTGDSGEICGGKNAISVYEV